MSNWKTDTTVVVDPSTATQLLDDTAIDVPSRVNAGVAVKALEIDHEYDALELDDQYDDDGDPYNRTGQFCVETIRRKND